MADIFEDVTGRDLLSERKRAEAMQSHPDGKSVEMLERELADVQAARAQEQADAEAARAQLRAHLQPQVAAVLEIVPVLEGAVAQLALEHFEYGTNPRATTVAFGARTLREALRGAAALVEALQEEIAQPALALNAGLLAQQERDLRVAISQAHAKKEARKQQLRDELRELGVEV